MPDLSSTIRNVPDFPRPGIVFRDITTLLKDPASMKSAVSLLTEHFRKHGIDKVAAIEARGFIFGALIARELNVGFVPLRKPGKLPAKTLREEYQLEYGTDALEVHVDAITPGERVLIHDDLLATGGTARAACRLVEKLGGTVAGLSFLIELSFLKARPSFAQYEIVSVIRYDAE
ncbi:MAG: adenine phosphoribosyltransferase [Bacteroidota bacterium]